MATACVRRVEFPRPDVVELGLLLPDLTLDHPAEPLVQIVQQTVAETDREQRGDLPLPDDPEPTALVGGQGDLDEHGGSLPAEDAAPLTADEILEFALDQRTVELASAARAVGVGHVWSMRWGFDGAPEPVGYGKAGAWAISAPAARISWGFCDRCGMVGLQSVKGQLHPGSPNSACAAAMILASTFDSLPGRRSQRGQRE